MIARVLVVIVGLLGSSLSLAASERRDIAPGEANWHRYRFIVVTSQVAVRQHVTVLWDNPGTGMLIGVYNVDNPSNPKLQALSTGNDRLAALDIGLMAGTYELVVAAAVAPTHYHLNSTYGLNEILIPRSTRAAPIDLFTERLMGEQLAPHLEQLIAAMRR